MGKIKLAAFFFGGAILAVAIYMVYEKYFKEKVPKLDTSKPDYSKVLKIGVIAPKEVMFLQNYLNSKATETVPKSILPKLKIDGIFGEKTRERLFEYMKKNETTLSGLISYKGNVYSPTIQAPPTATTFQPERN